MSKSFCCFPLLNKSPKRTPVDKRIELKIGKEFITDSGTQTSTIFNKHSSASSTIYYRTGTPVSHKSCIVLKKDLKSVPNSCNSSPQTNVKSMNQSSIVENDSRNISIFLSRNSFEDIFLQNLKFQKENDHKNKSLQEKLENKRNDTGQNINQKKDNKKKINLEESHEILKKEENNNKSEAKFGTIVNPFLVNGKKLPKIFPITPAVKIRGRFMEKLRIIDKNSL